MYLFLLPLNEFKSDRLLANLKHEIDYPARLSDEQCGGSVIFQTFSIGVCDLIDNIFIQKNRNNLQFIRLWKSWYLMRQC